VALDSSAPQSWQYEETGVAIVQEENGVLAKISRGAFRASSSEAARFTHEHEEFGDLFAQPKTFMPMFATADLAGTLPPTGATATVDTASKPEGPNPKIGLKYSKDVPANVPMYIGETTGGKIEIATNFQSFFSIEAVVGIRVEHAFPGGVYFKYEAQTLKQKPLPGSDEKIESGHKDQIIFALGVYKDGNFPLDPYPLEVNWYVFAGIGFTFEAKLGEKSVGVGIAFVASGSVQYPQGKFALAEVGVKVEGQGLLEFRGGDKFLVLKASLSIELTVAFLFDIEWEVVEGTVGEIEI
jgi:hypothetical protein